MTTTVKTITAEELFAMTENGGRNELLDGELLPMSPIGMRHMSVSGNIYFILRMFLKQHPVGVAGQELGCILSPSQDVVLAPDVLFIRGDRIGAWPLPEKYFSGAPDLAVEVLSPGDSWQEVETKVDKYLTNGTAMVWVVNPKTESVTVYQPGPVVRVLKNSDEISGEGVVDGFACKVAEFFAGGM